MPGEGNLLANTAGMLAENEYGEMPRWMAGRRQYGGGRRGEKVGL